MRPLMPSKKLTSRSTETEVTHNKTASVEKYLNFVSLSLTLQKELKEQTDYKMKYCKIHNRNVLVFHLKGHTHGLYHISNLEEQGLITVPKIKT